MKKNILPLLIILLPIALVVLFLWFLYGSPSEKLTGDLTASLLQKKAVSLKVDLGQDNIDTEKVLERSEITISDPEGNPQKDVFDINLVGADNGGYELKINPKKPTLRPGHYYVSAKFVTDQGVKDYTQDFFWGVLALNFDKSIYKPGETAYMQMAVLDDLGDTICGADLELKVINPQGREDVLNTYNGKILMNKNCNLNNVMDEPDYYAKHLLYYEGIYKLVLTAQTRNGERSITDFIEVKRDIPFEVQRKGPTRIFPPENYEVEFNIKANQNFKGEIVERVPKSFVILPSPDFSVRENGETKEIVWNLDMKRGGSYDLKYTFDAPNISPEFYLLGPLSIGDWQEERFWQIAADQIEYLRPTTYTDSASTTNPTYAYNTNDPPPDTTNSSQTVLNPDLTPSIRFHTWASKTQTYVGLLLKVHVATSGSGNDKYNVQYTINGSTWNDILASSNTAIPSAATYTVDLYTVHGLLDPANVQVRLNTDQVSGADSYYFHFYDIWTEGDYSAANNPPTLSKIEDGPDPAEVGNTVRFTAYWADEDTEGVNLFVCSSTGGTSGGCPATTYCSTAGYGTTDPMTCTYNTSSAGTTTYYAYVCDDSDDCSGELSGTFTVNSATPVSKYFDGKFIFDFKGIIK